MASEGEPGKNPWQGSTPSGLHGPLEQGDLACVIEVVLNDTMEEVVKAVIRAR